MYGLGNRGGTPGGRLGGAFPVHKTTKTFESQNKYLRTIVYFAQRTSLFVLLVNNKVMMCNKLVTSRGSREEKKPSVRVREKNSSEDQ